MLTLEKADIMKIIQIFYIRKTFSYINICTFHKKDGTQFNITNVFEQPAENQRVVDFYIISVFHFCSV